MQLSDKAKELITKYRDDLQHNDFYNLVTAASTQNDIHNEVICFLLENFTYEQLLWQWKDIPAFSFFLPGVSIDSKYPKSCVIPDTVTYLDKSCFSLNDNLISVEIPEGVKYVWDRAFMGCSSLRTINIPQSVKIVGYEIFTDCPSLHDILLPSSLQDRVEYMGIDTSISKVHFY